MHFIRHGQSEFNAGHDRLGRDPDIRDAPLTQLGAQQARRAAGLLAGKGVTQIISSPYTRALQTASIIAEAIGASMHVEPLAGERALYSCDVGTPTSGLRAAWAHLDFSSLAAEDWWPQGDETHHALSRRAAAFTDKWRDRLSGGGLALVSHWYFLNTLTGRSMENGEVYFKSNS